jgi:hypothetical protein
LGRAPALVATLLLGGVLGVLVSGAFLGEDGPKAVPAASQPADPVASAGDGPSEAGVVAAGIHAFAEPVAQEAPAPESAANAAEGARHTAVPARATEPPPASGRDAADRMRVDDALSRLERRVVALEQRLAAVTDAEPDPAPPPPPARTSEDRMTALRSAGVNHEVAQEIVWLQGQRELERLELRDLALREGWFATDRYRDELGAISEQGPDLRSELGDDVYDRYLYAAGDSNRVRVEGIITGSVAEDIGLRPGDVIESYGGERVLTFSDLRRGTSAGTRDELVSMEVRRADDSFVELLVPRGPLGVRLDLTRADPGD